MASAAEERAMGLIAKAEKKLNGAPLFPPLSSFRLGHPASGALMDVARTRRCVKLAFCAKVREFDPPCPSH